MFENIDLFYVGLNIPLPYRDIQYCAKVFGTKGKVRMLLKIIDK